MNTREPSIPSHTKLWWGRMLYWFQEKLLGEEPADAALLMIWGRAAEYPKTSGSHTSSVSIPNSRRWNCLP